MISLIFHVKHGEVVRAGLENLRIQTPKISRRRIFYTVKRISTRMRTEDPARVPSYDRTGKYQAGWPINPVPYREGYWLENRIPYAIFVVGDAYGYGQAYQHMGRWTPFERVIREETGKLPTEIENAISIQARLFAL